MTLCDWAIIGTDDIDDGDGTDVADHKRFMQALMGRLNKRKEFLQKRSGSFSVDSTILFRGLMSHNLTRYRVVNALLQQPFLDPKKRKSLSQELEHLLAFEKNFNEDVNYFNRELKAFEASPAYTKTVEHVTTDWQDCNVNDGG